MPTELVHSEMIDLSQDGARLEIPSVGGNLHQ